MCELFVCFLKLHWKQTNFRTGNISLYISRRFRCLQSLTIFRVEAHCSSMEPVPGQFPQRLRASKLKRIPDLGWMGRIHFRTKYVWTIWFLGKHMAVWWTKANWLKMFSIKHWERSLLNLAPLLICSIFHSPLKQRTFWWVMAAWWSLWNFLQDTTIFLTSASFPPMTLWRFMRLKGSAVLTSLLETWRSTSSIRLGNPRSEIPPSSMCRFCKWFHNVNLLL